jgi:thiol-disulfide isomerase/thioredoxin
MKQQALLILAFVTYILCGFQSVDAATTFSRKIVMEEGTGTWCGWCVRGIETIERTKQSYPDNFIAIALHTSDEMSGAINYDPIINIFTGFPQCIFNRSQSGTSSVSLWSAQDAVETMKDNAIAKIEATARYSDAKMSKVSVTTTTTFGFSQTNANFRIAYVVLEDKVGPYEQYNYYSGDSYSSTDYMYEWTQKESTVKVVFNDVARGIYGSSDGVDGSIPTTIEESQAYKYEYEFSLPTNISNKKNIRIVTLLINGETGEIENADETPITSEYEIQYFERKVVMEEATGTWCGWCVRGIETIERMKEKYPDNFIAIALHSSDQMDNAINYESIQGLYSSYPSCIFDRSQNGTSEVSIYSAEAMVNSKKDNAIAKISATASYDDASHSTVSIKTETIFGYRASNAKYRIAYVVLEDKVGPYSQNNYYSGDSYSSTDYMYEWTQKESTVNMVFNDVARGIYGSADGVEGSVPTTIEESKVYNYEYKLTLPDNIQDKNNIRIVTLLIDGETGEIENADETSVQSGATGMAQITIGKSGKASYCGNKSLDFSFSEEIKAYIATGFDKDEEIIWLTRVKDVPGGTPVLIKGEANKTYDVPVTDSKNSYYENMFKGNTSGATIQVNETEGDMVNYYLSGDGTFKSVKGYANIGNNKSYLQLPGTFAPAEAGTTQTVKVGSAGKASYAAPVDLDFTNVDGLKAFTATGYDKSTKTIWLTRVMKVQKGEGVLLKGDAKDYEIPSAAVQSSYMNMFVGNTSGASVQVQTTSEDGSQTNFYLKGDGTFVSVNGYVNIGNNKCYLELPTSMVSGVASTRGAEANYIMEEPEVIKLPISFRSIDNDGNGTTAIHESVQSSKEDGAYYSLQGQRVVNPGKGIYIKNGKKVIIR